MRYLLTLLLLTVSAIAQPFTSNDPAFTQSTSTLRKNLAGYWRLEESSGTRYDRSRNGNTLTSQNTVGQTAGKVGNCATFLNSSSQALTRANNSTINVGGISFDVSLWVYMTTKTNFMTFVGQWENTGARSWVVSYDLTSDRFLFVVSTNSTSNVSVSASSLGSPSTGAWYHISAWHDLSAHTINIKVNGGTTDSASIPSNVSVTTADFAIGALYVGGARANFLNGRIDEVGLWRRNLTTTERAILYNSGNGNTFPCFRTSFILPSSPSLTWPFAATGNYTLASVSTTVVLTPNGSTPVENNISTHRYHHHSRIAYKNGTTFVAFSSGASTEDAGGQQSAFCISTNKGQNWSAPVLIVPSQSTFAADNQPFQDGTRFSAPFAFYTAGSNPIIICVIGESTGDPPGGLGVNYIALVARELFTDGTTGPLFRITPEDYAPLDGFSGIDYDSNLGPTLIDWLKVFGSSGTGSTTWQLFVTESGTTYGEASTFSWNGGTNSLIRLYRCLAAGPTGLVALSTSTNGGATFNPIITTQIPNSPSYTMGIRLTNGKFAVVGNPQDSTVWRDPLFLALVNNITFETELVRSVRQGLTATPTYSGTYKGGGASYPDLVQVGNYIYVAYSTQKETVAFSRVLIPGLPDNNNDS